MNKIDEIDKRVRTTICNTWSNGKMAVEGRITVTDFDALLQAARDKSTAVTLRQFRDFVIREARVWSLDGSHHNPIWQRVAEALDAVGLNDGQICRTCDALDLEHRFAYADLCPECAAALGSKAARDFAEMTPALPAKDERPPLSRDPFPDTVARRDAGECTFPDCPCLETIGHCGDDVTPLDTAQAAHGSIEDTRECRVCGCTTNDCRQCIAATGSPCHWVEPDLCSACVSGEDIRNGDPLSCGKCEDGWLPAIEGADGSYVTSRPCKCDRGQQVSQL